MSSHAATGLSVDEIQAKINITPNPTKDKALIELVCAYLKYHKQDHTPFDAKRWITVMGNTSQAVPMKINQTQLIKKNSSIRNPALLVYLNDHHISFNIARQHLAELKTYSSVHKKHYFALGFRHENEGYFVSNPLMEDWIGDPSLSFIRGKNKKSDSLHIFHTFWDYLSLLSHLKVDGLETDTIILHSFDCTAQVKGYVYQSIYRKIYSWLPNNPEGRRAIRHISSLVRQEKNLIHITMNAFYQPFDNLNDWYSQANH